MTEEMVTWICVTATLSL